MKTLQKHAETDTQKILNIMMQIPALRRRAWNKHKSPFADVYICDDKTMKNLNWRFRKKNRLTDILSFEAVPMASLPGCIGELVICESQVRAQAKEFKHSIRQELRILILHGLLHLLGFDHETPQEKKKMLSWESHVAKLLKISSLIVRAQPSKTKK